MSGPLLQRPQARCQTFTAVILGATLARTNLRLERLSSEKRRQGETLSPRPRQGDSARQTDTLTRMIAPPMALTTGSPIGPYIIAAELGRGGMGVVYGAQTDPRFQALLRRMNFPENAANGAAETPGRCRQGNPPSTHE